MSPITHALVGWTVTLPVALERRDRGLVVLAAVVPDVDAVVVLADLAMGRGADSLELWSRYHHVLAHNLGFALLAAVLLGLLARRKLLVGGVAFLALHLHLLCDIVGSRGPDGYQWPVPYLLPFSDSWRLTVGWQWALNAWPNIAFTVALLALTLYAAWACGISPVCLVSKRADQALVATLRDRFGQLAGRRSAGQPREGGW